MNQGILGKRFAGPAVLLWALAVTAPAAAADPILLHFHGNTHDSGGNPSVPCSGRGAPDVVGCTGPFLLPSGVLDSAPAAYWEISSAALNNGVERSQVDPNWVWNLTAPTTVSGLTTLRWWASCNETCILLGGEWAISVWADGVKVFGPVVVTATPDTAEIPNRVTATVTLPEITASSRIVLVIDANFADTGQGARFYYDSTSACPGAIGGICDSTVTFNDIPPPPPPPEFICVAPGLTILQDATGDATDEQPAHDVQKLSLSQPYFANGAYKVDFHLKMADLSTVQPNTFWPINFCSPAFACVNPDVNTMAYGANNKYYTVRMSTAPPATPSAPVFEVLQPTAAGTTAASRTIIAAEPGPESNFTAAGLITIAVKASDLGLTPGGAGTQQLREFQVRIGENLGAAGTITPDNMPDSLVGTGSFIPVGNNPCAPPPEVDSFTGSPLSGYPPLAVDFAGTAHVESPGPGPANIIESYGFSFGDVSPDVTQAESTTSHTYTTAGNYSATLKVTDSRGQSADSEVIVQVLNRPPVAVLTSSAPTEAPFGKSPLAVTFDAGASSDPDGDSIVSYAFDFGDGSAPVTQPGATIGHTYTKRGTYDATLSVTDSHGEASVPVTVRIVVTPGPPVAQLAISPPVPAKGTEVTLDASFSSGDEVVDYTFDPGDFDPGDGSGPVTVLPPATSTSHVYHLSGDYTVSLSVRDTQEFVDKTTATITVTNTAPVADLTATPDPAEGQPPLTVSFDASGSYDPDAAQLPGEDFVESYEFDFGDGSPVETVSVPAIDHTYTTPGTYEARLTVYDHEGKKSSNQAAWPNIVVLDSPPVAVLGADQTAGAAPLSVVFDGAGSSDPDSGDSVVSYTFDFGDGSEPITRVGATWVQHVYAEPGDYDATLVVQDSHGAFSAPATLTIQVGPVNHAPIARASADKLSGNAPLDVAFDASASTDTDGDAIVEYTFDFGDGTAPVTQAGATATHTYLTPGRYAGSVTVKDARGALSSNSDAVAITANAPLGENTAATPFDDSKGPFSGGLPPATLLALGLLTLLRRRRGRS